MEARAAWGGKPHHGHRHWLAPVRSQCVAADCSSRTFATAGVRRLDGDHRSIPQSESPSCEPDRHWTIYLGPGLERDRAIARPRHREWQCCGSPGSCSPVCSGRMARNRCGCGRGRASWSRPSRSPARRRACRHLGLYVADSRGRSAYRRTPRSRRPTPGSAVSPGDRRWYRRSDRVRGPAGLGNSAQPLISCRRPVPPLGCSSVAQCTGDIS